MTWLWISAVVLIALALSAFLGAALVGWLLRRVEPEGYGPGILRGGTWIGILERLAITGAVFGGYPEAIAVVLAVKGLGRYPELRSWQAEQRAKATERFIIGTLASYIWAGAVGLIGVAVVAAIN
ncbi:hypothetical protein [Nesterenkonia jeotgali]|uniref:Uncharacterized protein n=1 Tax=Nesterenkonia jeotgali TaxID=317018 RepID=A0A0W8IE19_9MICC|nr:hypothetical protein [Nesterenkonia jeotgali]KUG58032.1 hypothetical protein AVL63_05945 [Nesterenkonia jeotgali]